jgi:hypothetical protein
MRVIFCLLFLIVTTVSSFSQSSQQMFWALNQNGIYILDQIGSTNASVAYSVRRLRRNYTGFAMKVRVSRPGTDPEGDVAFDATGVVSGSSSVTVTKAGGGYSIGDVVQFGTFYSGRSAYVTIWYDQSGNNRDVTQSTNSQQPRIVNSGSLETTNSIASIRFINSNSTVLSATIPSATMFGSGYIGTVSLVMNASGGNTSAFGYADGGSNRWQAHMNESGNLYFDVGNGYSRLSYNNSTNSGLLRTYALLAAPSKMQVWVSGVNVASSTPSMSASTTSTFYIGGIPPFPGSWYHDDDQSELIIFSKALANAEIGVLNKNQKAFFGTP